MEQKPRNSGLTRGERFADARKVHNRNGCQSLDKVATATGLKKSMIQELENDDSNRDVGYLKIQKLAMHYGVSVDWLLGLSNVPTVDPELDIACEVANLSPNAIKSIQRETQNENTRLALEVLLCCDPDLLHTLFTTIYKAVAGHFSANASEPFLEHFPPEYRERAERILFQWGGIVLEHEEAMQYNSFEAGNILSYMIDNSRETAIKKYHEIYGQLEISEDYYGND